MEKDQYDYLYSYVKELKKSVKDLNDLYTRLAKENKVIASDLQQVTKRIINSTNKIVYILSNDTDNTN